MTTEQKLVENPYPKSWFEMYSEERQKREALEQELSDLRLTKLHNSQHIERLIGERDTLKEQLEKIRWYDLGCQGKMDLLPLIEKATRAESAEAENKWMWAQLERLGYNDGKTEDEVKKYVDTLLGFEDKLIEAEAERDSTVEAWRKDAIRCTEEKDKAEAEVKRLAEELAKKSKPTRQEIMNRRFTI